MRLSNLTQLRRLPLPFRIIFKSTTLSKFCKSLVACDNGIPWIDSPLIARRQSPARIFPVLYATPPEIKNLLKYLPPRSNLQLDKELTIKYRNQHKKSRIPPLR